MNSRQFTNLSSQQEISNMLHRIKKYRVEEGVEMRFFVSSVGTVKVNIFKDGKSQWMLYKEAVKYIPYLCLQDS